MSRKSARIAAAVLSVGLALVAAAPASAWPFGGAAAKPAPKADPNAPKKATPEERAAAARLDPLARAAFWQHEVQIDPADAEAGVGLAAALRALGKYDEAADSAERVMVIAPKNEEAMLESARAHISAGHGFYALAPLKQAEALYPKDWRPVSLLGVALEQDERPDEALAAYNHALKLSPDNPGVLTNIALFYATRGDVARAEALLRQAVAQPTATAQERQNLALIVGLRGKLPEAEHLMRQDLPPEAADANLSYLKASNAPAAASTTTPAAPPVKAPARPPARTWDSVQQSDATGG